MGVADPPIVDVNKKVGFFLSKINDCFLIRGGLVIKDNLVGTCLRRRVENDSMLSVLLPYTLRSFFDSKARSVLAIPERL